MTEEKKSSQVENAQVELSEEVEEPSAKVEEPSAKVEEPSAEKAKEVEEAEVELMDATDDDDTDDEIEVEDPLDKVAELEQKCAETHRQLLRKAADLENFRKRSRRDVEDAAIRGRSEVLREILIVMDSVDMALNSGDQEGPAGPILQGVEMVQKQFLNATQRFGLKPLVAAGEVFDPNFHEAMAQVESPDHDSGIVMQEMRRGYMLGDRLLRASMVIVSKGAPKTEPDPESEEVKPDNNESEEAVNEDTNE